MSAVIHNFMTARQAQIDTRPAFLARIRLSARARGCTGREANAVGLTAAAMLDAGVPRHEARQRALSTADALVRQHAQVQA